MGPPGWDPRWRTGSSTPPLRPPANEQICRILTLRGTFRKAIKRTSKESYHGGSVNLGLGAGISPGRDR